MKIEDVQLFFSQSKSLSGTDATRFRGFKFYGPAGFLLDVNVHSDDGDAVAWLFDDQRKRLDHNDDAGAGTFDAHVTGALRTNAYHYVVFRDYFDDPATFTVTLNGQYAVPDTSCEVDSDCARVPAMCCASQPTWAAVRSGQEQLFSDRLGCNGRVCSSPDDGAIARCNQAKQCEIAPGTPPEPRH